MIKAIGEKDGHKTEVMVVNRHIYIDEIENHPLYIDELLKLLRTTPRGGTYYPKDIYEAGNVKHVLQWEFFDRPLKNDEIEMENEEIIPFPWEEGAIY